jgi:mono/diheme cytochrome c family protein
MNRENKSYPKMPHLSRVIISFSFLLMAGGIFSSCDRQKNTRGYDFIPDMVYSRAYETYSQNPNFKDSVTMRDPVAGTVPRGYLPFRYTVDSLSRAKAGIELVNPFLSSGEVLTRGKLMYTTFCIVCHGTLGKGDGQLYSSGLYPLKPREISGIPTATLKDGQIYHTITLGFGSMGAHGAQIRPDDRWKLVLYIRMLQNKAQEARDSTAGFKKSN